MKGTTMQAPPMADDGDEALPAPFAQAIAAAIAPVTLAPARRDALRERILVRAGAPFVTVRAADGSWTMLAPGAAIKMLHDDGTMQAFLLRLDAGACLPAHEHAHSDELCVVLEGTATLGDVTVAAGDYHLARRGSAHGVVRSTSGALLFIRTASGPLPHA